MGVRMKLCGRVIAMAAAVAAFFAGGVCLAADDAGRLREMERKLEENSRTIEFLVGKVRELESMLPARREPQPAEQWQEPATEPATALPMAAAPATGGGGALAFLDEVTWLHGFADVGLNYSGRTLDDGTKERGFGVGSLDFYLTPKIGDRVKSLVELIFEVDREGHMETELERLQIGYAFGDYATLWAGRFHTPLGYWNTAFHHGQQIQTSILRPRFLNFEEQDGVIPTHMVGLWGSGGARVGEGRLSYDIFAANGPKIGEISSGSDGELNPNTFGDDNTSFAFGMNLGYDFAGALDGLRVGAHALTSRVDGFDGGGTRVSRARLNLLGGYAVYAADDWEVIGEFYQFLNRDRSAGAGTRSSVAGFVQAGRLIGSFTPYARFEGAGFSQGDNYFSRLKEGESYRRAVAGLRYDLTPTAALKVEGNHTRILDRRDEDFFEVRSQFAIRF